MMLADDSAMLEAEQNSNSRTDIYTHTQAQNPPGSPARLFNPHHHSLILLKQPVGTLRNSTAQAEAWMVLYTVYRAKFLTGKKTTRFYIGFTGDASRREDKLGLGEMPWTSCVKQGALQLGTLHPDIDSKFVARALEAWEAARHIDKDLDHVRGGPWLKPTLPPSDKYEVSVVAKCRSLSQMADAREFLGEDSRFAKHMDDVLFNDQPKGPSKAAAPTVVKSIASARSTSSASSKATSTAPSKATSTTSSSSCGAAVQLPRPVKLVLNKALIRKPRSGTQLSGARRKFNKLSEAKPLAKKPAAAKRS